MSEKVEIRVRIPQLLDVRRAVELYYSRLDLSNADIKDLFGNMSSATVAKLKALAEAQRMEDGISRWSANRVNTMCAYRAWGIDIEDLEKRVKALDRLQRSRERQRGTSGVTACGL